MATNSRRATSQIRGNQWNKSNGFVNLRQQQDDIYNSGMPGENPFQTMYQATISAQGASRAQTATKDRHKTHAQIKNRTSAKVANSFSKSH